MWRLPTIMELSRIQIAEDLPFASATRFNTDADGVYYWASFYDFMSCSNVYKPRNRDAHFSVIFVNNESHIGRLSWTKTYSPVSYTNIAELQQNNKFTFKAEHVDNDVRPLYES